MDGGQDPVAGLPRQEPGTFPRCPGIPRSAGPPAGFQSIGFCQKANHQRFATAEKTHPEVESTTRQGLCSPCMGAGMIEKNQRAMELLLGRLGRVSGP